MWMLESPDPLFDEADPCDEPPDEPPEFVFPGREGVEFEGDAAAGEDGLPEAGPVATVDGETERVVTIRGRSVADGSVWTRCDAANAVTAKEATTMRIEPMRIVVRRICDLPCTPWSSCTTRCFHPRVNER